MKKVFCLLIIALSLCACKKTPSQLYKGYYSFKTGGTIDVSGTAYDIKKKLVRTDTIIVSHEIGSLKVLDTVFRYRFREDTVARHDTSFLRHLIPESGQMHILENGNNSMKVTMNILAGDPVVFDAIAEGSTLILSPVQRIVTVRSDDILEGNDYYLTVSGSGKSYDNMILLDLSMSGTYAFEGFDGTVTGSTINCIATNNE